MELLGAPLHEMLDMDELNNLYDLFDVNEAIPFRLRSNSISKFGQRIRKNSKEIFTRSQSLQSLANNQYAELDNISENFSQREREETGWKQRKADIFNEEKNSSLVLDHVNARNLKCPKIYVLGSHDIKIRNSSFRSEQNKSYFNRNEILKKSYSHIESTIPAYIKQNRNKRLTESYTYVQRSQVAIQTHQILLNNSPNSLNTTTDKKGQQAKANSYLKMSKMLDGQIRDDLKMNKGPIYFAQLTEENLEQYDDHKQLTLSDKFEFIFEWLEGMEVEECKPYFFASPFKLDQEAQTNVENITNNQDEESANESEIFRTKQHDIKTSKFSISTPDLTYPSIKRSRTMIDPFENPKHQKQERTFPKLFLKNSNGKDFQFSTYEKHMLAAKSDQTAIDYLLKNQDINKKQASLMKRCNESNLFGNQKSCSSIHENLKKQIVRNDILLTRMQLDLFII
jgi:hypothetical protein